MPANIRIFKDMECTQELDLDDLTQEYTIVMGPNNGLDGDYGDMVDRELFLKNIGDKPAMYCSMYKDGDDLARITMRTETLPFTGADLNIGDIMPGAILKVIIRVTVPKGSEPGILSPVFRIRYKTLP